MTILDRLQRLFGRTEQRAKPPTSSVIVAGSRLTVDPEYSYFGGFSFLPRRAYQNLDITTIFEDKNRVFSYAEILAILPDLDPDLSLALHNITRLASSDYTLTVYKAGSNDVVDKKAQKLADDFLKRVNKQYGGINNLIVQFTQTGYLQGAMAAEAVFDKATLKVIDIAPVNPYTIHFKPDENGIVRPFQYQPNPKNLCRNPYNGSNFRIAVRIALTSIHASLLCVVRS